MLLWSGLSFTRIAEFVEQIVDVIWGTRKVKWNIMQICEEKQKTSFYNLHSKNEKIFELGTIFDFEMLMSIISDY